MPEFKRQGEIIKTDAKKKQVFGWAYVTHDEDGEVAVDKSGEFVDDIDELEKTAYKFVLDSRVGSSDHIGAVSGAEVPVQKSTLIESMVFTPEKMEEMGIPDGVLPVGAWWVGFQIHDDPTWDRVEKGELTSFSVHGKGIKKKVED